jgi:cyclopropane-fatty-acyl-phospholipid synthase
MFSREKTEQRRIAVARELFSHLGELLQSRISVRLWDGSVVPLGPDVQSGLELSIRDPGVLGSLIRRPTAENLLGHYASGNLDYHGGDLVSVIEAARVTGSRQRARQLRKGLLARVAWNFFSARSAPAAAGHRFAGDDTGLRRTQEDNREFIHFHYDLSNDFYQLFLDPEMVYSCGYFRDWDESLEQAQRNKLEISCRKLRLQRNERLLDIGCGWGALVCHAAQHYGVRALGITLSEEQAAYARQKVRRLGLSNLVQIELCDYADVDTTFDKISSIGMVEHVGIDRLPGYMEKVRSLLRDRGMFLNHGITRPGKKSDKQFRKSSRDRRLLTKYIFPGGELDHQGHMLQSVEAAGFEVHDVEGWRGHYALTCRHWARRLEAQREQACRLVGEPRYRMWLLYLAAVGAAFQDGTARIYQAVATKHASKGLSGMPPTREALYASPPPSVAEERHGDAATSAA